MTEEKTIELYRILKKASPKGNFSDYESVIRRYESDRLSRCIASLQLPSSQAANFSFFEPTPKAVEALHKETEEYIAALQELESECRDCIDRKVDIGSFSDDKLWNHGKIDLSSVQNVTRVTGRLRSAKGRQGGGTYFQGSFPLLIFLQPAFAPGEKENQAYAKEFNKQLNNYVAAQSVKTADVKNYFQTRNYTFVSDGTVSYVESEANKDLTAAITKYTRTSSRKLAWSMLWRMLLLFAVLAVPTLILSFLDVRLNGSEWYWWIFYIVLALAAGIVPHFIFGSMNVRVHQIQGKEIRMFIAPFLVSCALLAAVMIPAAIHNGLLSIIFSVIYFVLYVVGTVVRYHLGGGYGCNAANARGLKSVLIGLFVALFSFCFGNLLLENRAACLTVNILASVACIATIAAGRAFTEYLDELDGELSTVMAYVLPIAAFLVGQTVQCMLYDAGKGVYIVGDIFGNVPLLFMILSAICCAACTALICVNNVFLTDNDMPVRGWIFNGICSVCFAVIPCFSGAVGVVLLPVVTFILDRVYYKEESFFALGVTALVLLYVLGQFVQYYFYVTGSSALGVASLLARVPLWLQIISTIVGAVAVGLTIYCYKESYPDNGSVFMFLIPGLLLGALPAVMSIPLLVVMSILTGQFAHNVDRKYMCIAPMITAFVVGWVLLWWNLVDSGNVALLSNLLTAFGVKDPVAPAAMTAFISTAFGIATCVMAIITTYRFFGRDQTEWGLWVMIPFTVLMIAIPATASVPLFVIVLLAMIFGKREINQNYYWAKDTKREKRIKSTLYAGMGVILGLQVLLFTMSCFNFTLAGKYSSKGIYYDKEDGYYYVAGYLGSKEMLIVPKTVKGHEVAGVTDEFKQNNPSTVYSLNYGHSDANDSAGMVIVLNSATKLKFPVPQREGYTFYGWWSSPDRAKGKQVTEKDGSLVPSATSSGNLYAMWHSSDYKFISSISEISRDLNGKYVLLNDIVISGNYTPISGLSGMETQSSRTAFNGVLDGNYHTVKYSIRGSRRYNGLFSWIGSDGIVKNLGVDADIDVTFEAYGKDYYAFAGGIAAINDGTIENCWSTGSVKLRNDISVAFAAGIAGASGTKDARTGAIVGCYNLANIESLADDSYASGILGSAENDGQTVSYCYNRGSIKATGKNSNNTVAGGIISHGRTHSENCFNAGAILTDYSDKQTLGGILGYIRNTAAHNCPPKNCAWLKASDCQAQWGVGKYPNDETGGNNGGVTVVTKEDNKLVTLLNAGQKRFVLSEGKLHLAWERYL